jgi:hypothetical protein
MDGGEWSTTTEITEAPNNCHTYRGAVAMTTDGKVCDNWSLADDNSESEWNAYGVEIGQHNFCRNPSELGETIWCQVTGDDGVANSGFGYCAPEVADECDADYNWSEPVEEAPNNCHTYRG